MRKKVCVVVSEPIQIQSNIVDTTIVTSSISLTQTRKRRIRTQAQRDEDAKREKFAEARKGEREDQMATHTI